jgi:hypothetical protein
VVHCSIRKTSNHPLTEPLLEASDARTHDPAQVPGRRRLDSLHPAAGQQRFPQPLLVSSTGQTLLPATTLEELKREERKTQLDELHQRQLARGRRRAGAEHGFPFTPPLPVR